jgi:hypothetical protein
MLLFIPDLLAIGIGIFVYIGIVFLIAIGFIIDNRRQKKDMDRLMNQKPNHDWEEVSHDFIKDLNSN